MNKEMKKNFIVLMSAIVMLFAASSCEKTVEQSSIYEISVEMITNADGSVASAIYKELAGKIGDTDAVLAYVLLDDAWQPMPAFYQGESYIYTFDDDGYFRFDAFPNSGYVWAGNFEQDYRIIRIPHYAFTEKKAEGVDHDNYNEVMRAYNLYEGNIIKK